MGLGGSQIHTDPGNPRDVLFGIGFSTQLRTGPWTSKTSLQRVDLVFVV